MLTALLFNGFRDLIHNTPFFHLFLSHFLAIWIIDNYALVDRSIHPYFYLIVVFVISIVISLLGVLLVEKKIKNYRFDLFKPINKY